VLAVACTEPVGIVTADGGRRRVEVRDVEALLLDEQEWQRLWMSEGTKGPRLFDWACVPILHRWEDDGRHFLLIRRSLTDPQENAYYFVFAPKGPTLPDMVEASGARWPSEEDARKRQRSASGPLRGAQLCWLVAAQHACAAGSGLSCRHLRHGAVLHGSSDDLSVCQSCSCAGPDRAGSAPSPCSADLARFFVRTPGARLVVVASLSPTACQLLP
jgi:hypothetical protein